MMVSPREKVSYLYAATMEQIKTPGRSWVAHLGEFRGGIAMLFTHRTANRVEDYAGTIAPDINRDFFDRSD